MKAHKFLIIGGDKRQLYLGEYLKRNYYDVKMYGFTEIESNLPVLDDISFKNNINDYDVKVFPLPFTKDGASVNASFSPYYIDIKEVLNGLNEGDIVFGGMIPSSIRKQIIDKRAVCNDYYESHSLQILNSIPTAEGIIKILIESLPITIHSMDCAIVGFGRTGKMTAACLKALNANVTVFARSRENLSQAFSTGCSTRILDSLSYEPVYFDALINTVPHQVIAEKQLKNINSGCLLIEIASSPFGIDFECARGLGFNVVKAPSLPGNVAPKSAGEIIGDTILAQLGSAGIC
ncbi:MAG: Dipicolinate synthase subunit A [Firmicutes bacterium ADurb.Bin300]|nr:MAG: Dipicolinate synthase subunit A [Firmicutes bacterium ADurb.Bin300]